MDEFFSKDDLLDLTSMLKYVERRTEAEIIVRITKDQVMIEQTARGEFSRLGLDTSDKSLGLLIYINLFQRKFALLAGKKILDTMGQDWLRDHAEKLSERFRKYQFGFGIHELVSTIGNQLADEFPAPAST